MPPCLVFVKVEFVQQMNVSRPVTRNSRSGRHRGQRSESWPHYFPPGCRGPLQYVLEEPRFATGFVGTYNCRLLTAWTDVAFIKCILFSISLSILIYVICLAQSKVLYRYLAGN